MMDVCGFGLRHCAKIEGKQRNPYQLVAAIPMPTEAPMERICSGSRKRNCPLLIHTVSQASIKANILQL